MDSQKGLSDVKFVQRALTPECERKHTQAPGSLRTINGADMFVDVTFPLGAIRTVVYTRLLVSLPSFMRQKTSRHINWLKINKLSKNQHYNLFNFIELLQDFLCSEVAFWLSPWPLWTFVLNSQIFVSLQHTLNVERLMKWCIILKLMIFSVLLKSYVGPIKNHNKITSITQRHSMANLIGKPWSSFGYNYAAEKHHFSILWSIYWLCSWEKEVRNSRMLVCCTPCEEVLGPLRLWWSTAQVCARPSHNSQSTIQRFDLCHLPGQLVAE
jgi:hypothetical protein